MNLTELKESTSTTDCRSDIGVTVGLIDGIIAQLRVLKTRDMSSKDVNEVLLDIKDDEDFKWFINTINQVK